MKIPRKNQNQETEIKEPFDPKRVDIKAKQMILDAVFKRLKNKEIDLRADFQRGENLWSNTQQSRLIESILIRLPLPAFYFDGSDDNRWLVVDGLQRLSSFNNFVINKSLKLQDLEYLPQFNGFGFDELPRELQRRIEEHEITAYIINPGTPEDVKFNLFRRINTGGLVLKPQEIRHALNQGIPAVFIEKLSKLEEFKLFKISTKRMNDRDFVTRFVAFYIHDLEEYKPDLDSFLNSSMSELKKFDEDKLAEIESSFKIALQAAWDIFGKNAFGKINNKVIRINKALFEVWTVNLSRLSLSKIHLLIEQKEELKRYFIEILNKDKEFNDAITTGTGDKKRVEKRFKTIADVIDLAFILR